MNTFLVEEFSEMPNKVVLNFGYLAEIRQKKKLQKEQSYLDPYFYLIEEAEHTIKDQSDVF